MLVFIRNLTKTVRRIRILKPKTDFFKVSYTMVEARAAGIPMKLMVSFETSAKEITEETRKKGWFDTLTVLADGH